MTTAHPQAEPQLAESSVLQSLYAAALMQVMVETAWGEPGVAAALLMAYIRYWLLGRQEEQLLSRLRQQAEEKRNLFDLIAKLHHTQLVIRWQAHIQEVVTAFHELERAGQLKTSIHSHLRSQAARLTGSSVHACPITSLLIMPNFIHMLHNRLHISTMQEVQLGFMLYYLFYAADTIPAVALVLDPVARQHLMSDE